MSQQQLLKTVVSVLENAGIEYMLTGSLVSSLQGEPRSTHDIDLVITLSPQSVPVIMKAFPQSEFYINEQSMYDAIKHESMFNLISHQEGDKVDFWVLTQDPFDQSRFSRRKEEEVFGLRLLVSTPEDTILAKLRWAKLAGGSEKHFRDALRVYELQKDLLDEEYLERWIKSLGLEALWDRLLSEAELL